MESGSVMKENRKSPLHDLARERGAAFEIHHGWVVAERFTSLEDEYRLGRERAGLADLSHRPKLRVTGAERVEFLNQMTTNDIKGLPPGRGLVNALLTVKGKMAAEMRVLNAGDHLLLDFDPLCFETAMEAFLKYGSSTKVEFIPEAEIASLGLLGPRSHVLLGKLGANPGSLSNELDHALLTVEDASMRAIRTARHGAVGYELWGARESLSKAVAILEGAFRPPTLGWIGWGAIDVLRVEAGIPWFGVDMDDSNFPQEVLMESALSFTKGCYLGQETVARIKYRGHVNQRLVGLTFEGTEPPRRGIKISKSGKEVGRVTSAVLSPGFTRPIGLGLLQRGFDQPGDHLEVDASPHPIACEVAPLPFQPDSSTRLSG